MTLQVPPRVQRRHGTVWNVCNGQIRSFDDGVLDFEASAAPLRPSLPVSASRSRARAAHAPPPRRNLSAPLFHAQHRQRMAREPPSHCHETIFSPSGEVSLFSGGLRGPSTVLYGEAESEFGADRTYSGAVYVSPAGQSPLPPSALRRTPSFRTGGATAEPQLTGSTLASSSRLDRKVSWAGEVSDHIRVGSSSQMARSSCMTHLFYYIGLGRGCDPGGCGDAPEQEEDAVVSAVRRSLSSATFQPAGEVKPG